MLLALGHNISVIGASDSSKRGQVYGDEPVNAP